jgi:hypothetical protein
LVPLPDVRPEDRSSFRALVQHLQLGIPCWQPDTSADEQLLAELNDLSQHISCPEAGQKLASLQSCLAARLSEAGCASPAVQAAQQAAAAATAGWSGAEQQQQQQQQEQQQRQRQQRQDSASPAAAAARAAAAVAVAAASTTGAAKQACGGELVLRRPSHQGGGSPPVLDRSAATSQLYYITTRRDRLNGISLSICTEEEFRAASSSSSASPSASPSPSRLDILCDVTWSDSRLTYTVVCKKAFRSMHIGATSRNQLRRRGMHIPHYGWHSSSLPHREADSSSSGGGGGKHPVLDLTAALPALWRKGETQHRHASPTSPDSLSGGFLGAQERAAARWGGGWLPADAGAASVRR